MGRICRLKGSDKQMKINQRQRIIDYIKEFGSITSRGITQLATRIKELKDLGYEFETKWESSKNRFKEPVSFKRYYLADMVAENMNHIPRIDQEAVMKEKCSKCDSEKLFVEIQGNRRGLYCGKCG